MFNSYIQNQVEQKFSSYFGPKLFLQKFKSSLNKLEFLNSGATSGIQFTIFFDASQINGTCWNSKDPEDFTNFTKYTSEGCVDSYLSFVISFCQWLEETFNYSKTPEYISQSVLAKTPETKQNPFFLNMSKLREKGDGDSGVFLNYSPNLYSSPMGEGSSNVDLKEVYIFCERQIKGQLLENRVQLILNEDSVELLYPKYEAVLRATIGGNFEIVSSIALPSKFSIDYSSPISTQNMCRIFSRWFFCESELGFYL